MANAYDVWFGRCSIECFSPLLKEINTRSGPDLSFTSDSDFGRYGGANLLYEALDGGTGRLAEEVLKLLLRPVRLIDVVGFRQQAGAGLERHADPVAVVSLQIAGRKRWRFFSADQVPEDLRALRRALPDAGGGPLVSAYMSQHRFEGGVERMLEPGDFVVMAPFTVHETAAIEQGLSFSATLDGFEACSPVRTDAAA